MLKHNKVSIIFDLDGTLIEISNRYYHVYKKIVDQLGGNPLSKNIYWAMRRRNEKLENILYKSGISSTYTQDFLDMFIAQIEDPKNLSLDTVFEGTYSVLDSIRKKHDIYLLTLRHSKKAVLEQLEYLHLRKRFEKIITADKKSLEEKSKNHLIKRLSIEKKGIIIGDTEAEITAAKAIGIPSIAVLSGTRNRKFLLEQNPSYIIKNINKLPMVLKNIIA